MLDLSKLNDAIRHEGGVSRRLFLAYAASLSAIPMFGRQASAKTSKPKLTTDPFQIGIASGDPTPDGVVLWTRLAPQPLEPGGGMEPEGVQVAWEIAEDDSMRRVIKRGVAAATPDLAHSVHVEVDGLAPDRWYWYRFRSGDAESPIGRTRTMPAEDALPPKLQFAFASCQNYEDGLYTAYEHMAEEELDLVLHLGDYIYEGVRGKDKEDEIVRRHVRGVLKSLDDYRIRHAQYKTDPHLQAIHRRCPWLVTWDDHEVSDDYANDQPEKKKDGSDPAKFLARRAAAYQAYYEMMPLRKTSLPHGPQMQIYRQGSFGRLANVLMLDGRQYRSKQVDDDKPGDLDEAAKSPASTMLGRRQIDWLEESLTGSAAAWNVLGQQTIMALVDTKEGSEHKFSRDAWAGYVAERNALMEFLHARKIANPVVLSGDNHANWVNELRTDDLRTESPIVATEFVGTSISSGGHGGIGKDHEKELMAKNAGVRFFNNERGYVRCTVTPKEWRSDFRTVADVSKPGAPITTRATFVIEAGQAGAKQA